MTRGEVTGVRDLTFSTWIRNHLPDSSTGFSVTDLDFILFNHKTHRIALVEVKTRNADMRFNQKVIFRILHYSLKHGLPDGWEYINFYFIKFEHQTFSDGKVYLNNVESTEEEVRKVLSLE